MAPKTEIIIRFPSVEVLQEFCVQMTDGFGEGWCLFQCERKKANTEGNCKEDFEAAFDEQGRLICFIDSISTMPQPATSEQ